MIVLISDEIRIQNEKHLIRLSDWVVSMAIFLLETVTRPKKSKYMLAKEHQYGIDIMERSVKSVYMLQGAR